MSDETPKFQTKTAFELLQEAKKTNEFRQQMRAMSDDNRQLPTPWTWENLVEIEPRLEQLESDARILASSGVKYDAYAAFYGNPPFQGTAFKDRLIDLAGHQAAHPALYGSDVYDFVYDRILDILIAGGQPEPWSVGNNWYDDIACLERQQ